MITKANIEDLSQKIVNEGFDYAMLHYSSWTDVKDDRFHELHTRLCIAHSELEEYLRDRGVEVDG